MKLNVFRNAFNPLTTLNTYIYNNGMQFELDETLVDSILFSMEDQNDTFLVDTHEADVVSVNDLEEEEFEDDEHYISLPEWDSNDGFRLMERFAV